jgi:hypothetical protein
VGERKRVWSQRFREAEDGNAVLFFDEAQALFGTRGGSMPFSTSRGRLK